MIDTWLKYKLSEIGTIVGGATPSTNVEAYYNGDIPWLTPKDLSDFQCRYIEKGKRNITKSGLDSCSAQLLPAGSVLFSSRAPIGYIAIAKNPMATNQGFKSIIPNKGKIDSLFLYYLLKYNKNNIEALGSGTTFKEVSGFTMKNIEVFIPPLKTQQQITGILGAIDDKIELNCRINENLEQQAQALFKAWFVDFEPFKDGKFVDSELGKIPEGWKVGKLNDLVKILSGFAFKSNTFVEKGKYQLITIKAVQDGQLNIAGANYINDIPPQMPQYCFLKKGDILLSLTGNVGRTCIVTYNHLLLNQRVAKIESLNCTNRMFIYTLLRQLEFKNKLISLARGTAQLNLSPIEMGQINIIIPSEKDLKKYSDIMNNSFDKILNNNVENIILSELRDKLLPKLMSGKFDITDINNKSL